MAEDTAKAGSQTHSADGSGERLFTQEEVSKLIEKRLARAKAEPPDDYEELKEKAARLDEIEESAKTDLEKANERAAKAEAEIAEYKAAESRRKWNESVAKATGVPEDVLAAMAADSEDALMEKAESMKGYFDKPSAPVVGSDGFAASTSEQSDSANEWLRSTLPGNRR